MSCFLFQMKLLTTCALNDFKNRIKFIQTNIKNIAWVCLKILDCSGYFNSAINSCTIMLLKMRFLLHLLGTYTHDCVEDVAAIKTKWK